MIEVTVKLLAEEIQISVGSLIKQFADAGVYKSENDTVTQHEKEILLMHLNRNSNRSLNKLTLKRKPRSTLSILSSKDKGKLVQIEVRKKRTFVKYKKEKEEDVELEKNQVKTVEETKREIIENKKVRNQKINSIIKINYSEKTLREVEVSELKRKAEEETLRKIEEGARRIAEEARKFAAKTTSNQEKKSEEGIEYHITTSRHARQAEDETDCEIERGHSRTRINKAIRPHKGNKHSEAKTDREEARAAVRSSKSGKYHKGNALQQIFNKPEQIINRNVIIGETITIAELANKMAVKGSYVIKTMMKMGAMVNINQVIDQETAQLVAEEMGHKVILRRENELEEEIMSDRNVFAKPESRAPVVTIMGHVDHGKTSLLDYIRSTKIASGEIGGITQHIGAYHVETNNGMITFLDTPGHSAFTAMRARGVQITDIVVLVVAADDGVMPQTIEAIQHAKAANVPIVVAINKIDKLEADPDRVKSELAQHGVISDTWGGDSIFVNVSAKIGTGIDDLLNAILLQAEVLELSAVQDCMANGVVIESFLDKGCGPIATVLVREGTLRRGDTVLCGLEYGRIRAMRDELGYEINKAGPSIPVKILGLSGVPSAGDEATVVRSEKKAREVALYRQGKFREVKLANWKKSKIENVLADMNKGNISELNVVLKGDVQGTVQAIVDVLLTLSNDKVKVKIVGFGVGGITETDAMLAAASKAIILGFNVRADSAAQNIIEKENLKLRYYSVIYNLIDEVKVAMNGMIVSEYQQHIIGTAEVRSIFRSLKLGAIAGCMVTNGMVQRHNPIRILRDNIVIYKGELESLRRFKEDVNEVRSGMECGIGVKNYNDVRVGDIIEVLELIETKTL